MEFSRQEYWSGLLFPPPSDLPDPPGNPFFTLFSSKKDKLLIHATTWMGLKGGVLNRKKSQSQKVTSHVFLYNSLEMTEL